MQGLELRLQENELYSQQSLEDQKESNRLLRQQLEELQKRLKDKENKLIEATEVGNISTLTCDYMTHLKNTIALNIQ